MKILNKNFTILAVLAFVFTLFLSTMSPFQLRGSYVDHNAFLTVGRALKHGSILYKDVYDQKGPIFLFIFYLQALISEKYMVLLFVLMTLVFFTTMHYAFKLAKLFNLSDNKARIISCLSVIFIIIIKDSTFVPETLLSTIIMYYMYTILNNLKNEKYLFSKVQYFISGVLISVTLFTKVTFIFMFFALMFMTLLYLLKHKNIKELVNLLIWTSCGLIVTSLPVIIYFGAHHYLHGFINDYLVVNLKYYGSIHKDSFLSDNFYRDMSLPWSLVQNLFRTPAAFFAYNSEPIFVVYKTLILANLVFLIFKKNTINSVFLNFSLAMMFGYIYGAFFGKLTYFYYIAPAFMFIIIGAIVLLSKVSISKVSVIWLALLTVFITIGLQPSIWKNYTLFKDSRPTEVSAYANYINSHSKNKSVVQMSLDSGIYNELQVLPLNKYFYKPNGFQMYKGLWENYFFTIKKDKPDFIVYNKDDSSQFNDGEINFIGKINKEIKTNYKLVKLKGHYSGDLKVLQRSK